MKYKNIVVPGIGGTEIMQIVENDLRLPALGEARVKILAAPVCQDDVAVRKGDGVMRFNPSGGMVFEVGDILVALGETSSLDKLKAEAT